MHELPTAGSEPHGISLDRDGSVWAALETGALVRVSTRPGT
ncbi:hypothetical protein [Streptomyces sp. NPDC005262]